jgi:hypothetical protein
VPVTSVDYISHRLICEVEHFSMYAVGTAGNVTTPDSGATGTPTPFSGGGGSGGSCFLRSLW